MRHHVFQIYPCFKINKSEISNKLFFRTRGRNNFTTTGIPDALFFCSRGYNLAAFNIVTAKKFQR